MNEAIAVYEDELLRRMDLQSTPLGYIGQTIALVAGAKESKPEHYNVFALHRKRIEAKREIDEEVARSFVELEKKGKVPAWVVDCINFDTWQLAASD